MKIDDPKTKDLLCEWANHVAFLCDGLDDFLRYGGLRNESLPAPLTLESCEALTEEEMQKAYDQFGLTYYPDIPFSVRAWYLWQSTTLYRYWGTPRALEVLSQYIMGDNPIELVVHDNLAFNDQGDLIDEDLLDVFDVEILAENPVLSDYTLTRILANLCRVVRNQEYVEGFTFTFPEEFSLEVHYGYAPEASVVLEIENDELSTSPAITAKAFTRSSAYQNLNKSLSANTNNYLYEEGMNTTLDVISGATYTLTGAFTAAGVSVDITVCSLYTGSVDGKLRLSWGPTAAAVCYIEYNLVV